MTETETETAKVENTELNEEISDESAEELARPALTIKEAAMLLGKSVRALERSILGRWGNKLPDGWVARKMTIDGREEWRIIPPESFKVRHRSKEELFDEFAQEAMEDESLMAEMLDQFRLPAVRSQSFQIKRGQDDELGQSTIIIDRSEDVEKLLKELVKAHQALAEETRQHVEDLRMLNEMTNSMRLLESNQSETGRLRDDLAFAQTELIAFKKQYQDFLALPWWKKIFRRFP